MATTTLKVSGMTCDHCVRAVSNALGGLEGVRSADVNLENGVAVVSYDEERIGTDRMVAAVADEGYTAEEAAA